MSMCKIGLTCAFLVVLMTLLTGNAQGEARRVTVGPVSVEVPVSLKALGEGDLHVLRTQFEAQSAAIYRKYYGAQDPTKTVNVAGFRSVDGHSTLALVAMQVPPRKGSVLI